jgi:predicted kinase
MEAILFIGIQATGKSTFYKRRFAETHAHINLDTLKTRRREASLLSECLDAGRQFVIDNTNVSISDRAKYLALIKPRGFRVVGYYFESKINDALKRNATREGKGCIPRVGVLGTYGKLQVPELSEGFDALFYVRIGGDGEFIVEDWEDEV